MYVQVHPTRLAPIEGGGDEDDARGQLEEVGQERILTEGPRPRAAEVGEAIKILKK